MKSREIKFPSKKYGNMVPIKAIPGHFVTNHSHINYFIDLTTIKTRTTESAQCARVLAQQYIYSAIPVDSIVCLDGMEVIGAFLAKELNDAGHSTHNAHKSVYVIQPERTANSQLFFRENVEPMIRGKNVILLMASVTTGISIRRGIFTPDDIPGYASYDRKNCPYCQKKVPVEALVNSFGYSKL